jgi:hypothetical protein
MHEKELSKFKRYKIPAYVKERLEVEVVGLRASQQRIQADLNVIKRSSEVGIYRILNGVRLKNQPKF